MRARTSGSPSLRYELAEGALDSAPAGAHWERAQGSAGGSAEGVGVEVEEHLKGGRPPQLQFPNIEALWFSSLSRI